MALLSSEVKVKMFHNFYDGPIGQFSLTRADASLWLISNRGQKEKISQN
jgi:hypothetical protein